MDAVERFWAKVDKSGECWIWTASKSRKGYGRFSCKANRRMAAHRFAYELANGPIPDGLQIDHRCHQAACVNPAHLRLATAKQNLENRGLFRNNTSGVRGVYWSKHLGKWHARVSNNGKFVSVGFFTDLDEAERAVVAKRLELFTHNDADRSTDLIDTGSGKEA